MMHGGNLKLFVTVSFRMTEIDRDRKLCWKGIKTPFRINFLVMPHILHSGRKHWNYHGSKVCGHQLQKHWNAVRTTSCNHATDVRVLGWCSQSVGACATDRARELPHLRGLLHKSQLVLPVDSLVFSFDKTARSREQRTSAQRTWSDTAYQWQRPSR
jgi:hypothetical protein